MCAGGKVRRALPLSSSVELSWVPSHTRLNPGQELSFIVALEAKVMWTIYKKYHWMSIQSFRLKVRISKGPASPGRPLQQSVWWCAVPRSGTDAQLNSGLGKKSDRPEAWVDKNLRCSVVVRERGPAEGGCPPIVWLWITSTAGSTQLRPQWIWRLCHRLTRSAGTAAGIVSSFDRMSTWWEDFSGTSDVHIKAPCTLMKPIRLPILQIFILRWARLSLTSCWEVFPHQEREGSVMRTGNKSSLDLIWFDLDKIHRGGDEDWQ